MNPNNLTLNDICTLATQYDCVVDDYEDVDFLPKSKVIGDSNITTSIRFRTDYLSDVDEIVVDTIQAVDIENGIVYLTNSTEN